MLKYQQLKEARRNGERGFTLIELLVVMVIIGLLAAIAIPLFLSQKDKAKESALKNDLRNMATYAETFAVDNDTYTGFDQAAATAGGFKQSDSYGNTALTVTISAGGDAFCIQGDAGTGTGAWSYDSVRTPQLDNATC
jgi:type IV pilus assembly protein PilA